MDEISIDQRAEQVLRAASAELTAPEHGECLPCFVVRMLDEFGCDGTLRVATHYRDQRVPRATALEARLGRMGGFCDCEIFLNGLTLAQDLLEFDEAGEPVAPDPMPECRRVRTGSARPCSKWERRGRMGAW